MRKTRTAVAPALALALALASALGIAPTALPAQSFRERVNVELVRVELIATDAKGQPVKGLAPVELQVRVDGRPVRIESFEAPPASPDSVWPPPAAPVPAPPSMPAPAAPREGQRYDMAILVDETSSSQFNRQSMFTQLFEFLDGGLPPGVFVMLLEFDGALHIQCPWTSDLDRLRKAAAALRQRRAVSRLGPPGNLTNLSPGSSSNPGLESMAAALHARTSLAALFDSLRAFREGPGRKALFFVTDGGPFLSESEIARDLIASSGSAVASGDPDALRRAALEAGRDGDLLLDSLAWDRNRSASLLIDIARLALLRGIEIHPVRSAPHDLGGGVTAEGSFRERATARGGAPPDPRSQRGGTPLTDIAAGQGMEAMAATTGGEAVLSRRFFQDGMRREVDLRDAAYELAFPDPFAGNHRYHRIEIASANKEIRLRYRRGYRILDVREALLQATANRMVVASDQNPLGVRLQMESLGVQKGQAVAELTVAYPAPPEAGGAVTPARNVEILGVCAVKGGQLSQPIDMTGRAIQGTVGPTAWLVRSDRIRVKPGAYRWSFAIRDGETGITSYLTFDRALP